MGKHRAEVRPRYGRIAVLGSSLAVTMIAVLGGTGALPQSADRAQASLQTPVDVADPSPQEPTGGAEETPDDEPAAGAVSPLAVDTAAARELAQLARLAEKSLPADSGQGRRVVFSESRQRVWLVGDGEEVEKTYPVSGSVFDNLEPGTFEVYSRSEDATGIDDSGTMKYFVRFTQGDTGAAIGFHDIPVLDGERVQGFDELGTPLSHGCIRQRRSDAIALWDFAPLGTTVVVTA